ncbi:ribulose-phosphate 3-epimerase [Clostridium sp.]|uniref:ribulose-phosphate 3-epimerase n=1 Tax=Clostridium sp. TaxID=1506 RepID=UPI00283F745F|nr:ribulose-phosphate 3-epimerase [Clostridium sp.]MDR3597964.1 ribulose-phosphate 3-epimerase [Clostridium sp.]
MIKIAPSIMCADPLNVEKELRHLEECGIDMLHCDVMDGQYVDNLAMGFYLIKAIKRATKIPLDIHLAVMEPERYLDILASIGVDMVSVHVERTKNMHRTIKRIKELGMKASIAINPSTPVCIVQHVLKYVDMILVMTVDPGFEGQSFIYETIDKIKEIKGMSLKHNPSLLIEVDGNINTNTIPLTVSAGANVLVLGTSSLFNSADGSYMKKIDCIKKLIY